MKLLATTLLLTAALATACNRNQPETVDAPAVPPTIPGPDLMQLSDSGGVAEREILAYGQQYPATEVIMHTRLGDMRIKLYDDTPLHKANFLLLSRKGVFDETVFHRVVKGFAIQGGNSNFRTIRMREYHLKPEIRPAHFHKYGALAMARYDGAQNPGKLSSNNDFYIVQGQKMTAAQAKASAARPLTPEQVKVYTTVGGTPGLDGEYTVFGEVIEGFDVIDKIANEPLDPYNWPKKDVKIKMEVVEPKK
ncbi:peptidyl-prolyl cis-trans isomerase B (cyclophilin B) [Hymenobacter gelipurpurascens]|uniref:Peptidyl-prolyl cis-trans isomerase n=1 Tax=Hymenobacter gelipurpurascens TaxID=89968 RepID=A0A212TN70_9BACT|nr:peptidylprolyl isomerase [Hymenobacter gelipurpurascens]SNC67264.1 peptidyl-prolyl cis-trans isomerase B (cyclophilin B) [Hymenobacter gelipurpurascens]